MYHVLNVNKRMCGRTACVLCKEDIQKATQRYSVKNEPPKWIEKYFCQRYSPSYNLSPSQISPVLINENTIDSNLRDGNIALFPMKWGLVPSWYKYGRLEDYSLKTNNCRLETILEKPMYKNAITIGRRCVIVVDGYYEWKTVEKGKKQPYLIHFPEENGIKMCNRSWTCESFVSEKNAWNGPRLLTMAGIFDVLKSHEVVHDSSRTSRVQLLLKCCIGIIDDFGDLYSYSVITMDSSKIVSSIHHRMPAILDGDSQVQMWLNSKEIPFKEALANLKSVENLDFYPVSTEVNNSRNNTIHCVKPLIIGKSDKRENTQKKQNTLMSWLKRESEPKEDSSQSKRMKSSD